VNLEDVGV